MKKLINILFILISISLYSQTKLDSLIVDEINYQRSLLNICPVKYEFDSSLYIPVRNHSKYMNIFRIVSHEQSKGDTIINGDTIKAIYSTNERYKKYLEKNRKYCIGENVTTETTSRNISLDSLEKFLVKKLVFMFMNECDNRYGIKPHRESLMNINSDKCCVSVDIIEIEKTGKLRKMGENDEVITIDKTYRYYMASITVVMVDKYPPEIIIEKSKMMKNLTN